jgi:cytochrome c-type biogenesis protein CcmH/NrfF
MRIEHIDESDLLLWFAPIASVYLQSVILLFNKRKA